MRRNLGSKRSLPRPVLDSPKHLLDRRAQAIRAELREHDAVNIDCWRAFDSVHLPVFDVTANIGIVFVGVELRIESFAIDSHLGRVFFQRIRIERALVLEQKVMYSQNFPCALAA